MRILQNEKERERGIKHLETQSYKSVYDSWDIANFTHLIRGTLSFRKYFSILVYQCGLDENNDMLIYLQLINLFRLYRSYIYRCQYETIMTVIWLTSRK